MVFLFILISFLGGDGDSSLGQSYLAQHSSIAVAEMQRSGIPASIKLAQGMLESDYGRSELATKAYNHFGIKCGNSWNGKGYYRKDDDYNSKGDLMKSCFRVFDSAYESYVAHSEFLTDPKKQYRYGTLFELDPTDYRAWAHGLKDAGYATDPSYPDKLILIIEKYQLYRFDEKRMIAHDGIDKNVGSTQPSRVALDDYNLVNSADKDDNSRKRVDIKINNRVRYVMPYEDETVESLARRVGINIDDLLAYNDHLDFPTESIPLKIPVYLEMKSRDYKGPAQKHRVQSGEDINMIAQLYGVRVASLRSLNKIAKTGTPIAGEMISLKQKVKTSQRPKCVRLKPKAYIF